jgi:NADPH:quinone reductase-like Zn-dependent oxidoreductase
VNAIQLDAFGGPEVLHAAQVPEPHPGPGQVRVRLRAVGVNPFEAKVRAGAMRQQFTLPLPAILGNEISGVVDELGAGVTGLAGGDEVFGWSDTGAYAELALATVVAPKPRALAWELAAALPVAAETATRVLEALQLQQGETLLVHGGAGVVGNLGVQLALLRGAKVIATAAEANHAALRALGATPLTYGDRLVERVRALGRPIDAVFDAAGKGALPDSIALRGGTSRLITIADPAAIKLGVVFSAGTPAMRNVAILHTIGALVSAGQVTVTIAATMPLASAARAHALMDSGHPPGKIVLLP